MGRGVGGSRLGKTLGGFGVVGRLRRVRPGRSGAAGAEEGKVPEPEHVEGGQPGSEQADEPEELRAGHGEMKVW